MQAPIAKIAEALGKAQSEMPEAEKNQTNPHFKSKFADLASVRAASIPHLTKNGLAMVQTTHLDEGSFYLKTRLIHVSGEILESVYPLPRQPDKPQVMGSALTYAKRYTWSAICGLAADPEDDGDTAQAAGDGRKKNVRDIAYGVGTGQPQPPTFDIHDQFGDVVDTAGTPKIFLDKLNELVETSGAYWPNNKANVTWIGDEYKGTDKELTTLARQVWKMGNDAHKNWIAANRDPQAPLDQ